VFNYFLEPKRFPFSYKTGKWERCKTRQLRRDNLLEDLHSFQRPCSCEPSGLLRKEPVMMAGLSSQRPSCLSAQTASPTALFTRSPRVSWALPSRKTSANSENCSFSVSRRTLSRRKIGNDRILCAAAVTSPVRTFSIPQVVSWHLSPAFV
jgi:hypothetical protein